MAALKFYLKRILLLGSVKAASDVQETLPMDVASVPTPPEPESSFSPGISSAEQRMQYQQPQKPKDPAPALPTQEPPLHPDVDGVTDKTNEVEVGSGESTQNS